MLTFYTFRTLAATVEPAISLPASALSSSVTVDHSTTNPALPGGLAAPVGAVAGGLIGHAVGKVVGAEATASGEAGDVEVVPAPGDGVAAAVTSTVDKDAGLMKVEERKQ